MLDSFTEGWLLSRLQESAQLTSWLNFAWIFVFMVATQVAMTFARFVHRQFMPTLTLGRFFGAQEIPSFAGLFNSVDAPQEVDADPPDQHWSIEDINPWYQDSGGAYNLPPAALLPPDQRTDYSDDRSVYGDAFTDYFLTDTPSVPSASSRSLSDFDDYSEDSPFSDYFEDAPSSAPPPPPNFEDELPASTSSSSGSSMSESEMEYQYRLQKNGW